MITLTTIQDDDYHGLSESGEAADGTGLSLREAISLIFAGASTGPITFDNSLIGSVFDISLSRIAIGTDLFINGDITSNNMSDVTLSDVTGFGLFDLTTDNLTLDLNYVDIDIDLSATSTSSYQAITVAGESSTINNSGQINVIGVDTGFGDRSQIIRFNADNFTLNNSSDGSMITTGRFVIDSGIDFVGDDILNYNNLIINNDGYMEAADDAIRMGSGEVNNTGTITSSGTYDIFNDGILGQTSDGISAFIYDLLPTGYIPPSGPFLTVNNASTGLIDGVRAGVISSVGGTINNDGVIQAQYTGILAQGFLPDGYSTTFTLNNTGTVERTGGGNFPNASNDTAAILLGLSDDMANAEILNSGLITSPDMAISIYGGITLTNALGGVIQSDNDTSGSDDIAYKASIYEDFEVVASISFPFVGSNLPIESSQDVMIDSNGDLVINGVGTFIFNGSQSEVANIGVEGVDNILPLVDINATIQNNYVTFLTDGFGTVYAPSMTVTSTNLGVITISFASGEFTITDSTGNTLYNVPTLNFEDSIINDGSVFGDIITGLGDDYISNNGTIDGDIDLGRGDDIFIAGTDTESIIGGLGSDIVSYENASSRIIADLFNSAINFGIAAGDTYSGVENLVGSNWADQLRGDSGVNELNGGVRSDRLYGRAGDDVLNGEGGADAIYGNAGADIMTGGADSLRDRFIYFQEADSGHGLGNRDIITDFTSGEDRIEISRLDANSTIGGNQMFVFVADAVFSNTAGELRYEKTGGITLIQADMDGDGLADFEIELTSEMDLMAADFLL